MKPEGRYSVTEIHPRRVESTRIPDPGSVSIHAGPVGTFRGPIVAFAILGPIGTVGLVLWLLPRVMGLDEMRALRSELGEARREIAALRAEVSQIRELREEVAAAKTRERHNTELVAAMLNKLGSNVRFQDGSLPSVEFHAAPLSPRAAPVQPKETLMLP